MKTLTRCPYCGEEGAGLPEGQHRCAHCDSVFRVSLAGTVVKGSRNRVWIGCELVGAVVVFVSVPIVFFGPDGPRAKTIGMACLCAGMFLAFFGSFVHALCTGEILMTKRPCYKKEGVLGYYVCLVVTGLGALVSLAVLIKFCTGEL